MKTVACIIARTNSIRLTKKVLREIVGRTMIEHIIDKMKQVKNLDAIYLCTSVDPDDKVLLEIAEKNGIKSYAGSRTSVIDRMLAVAEIENATNVVRITGDNIFTDEIFLSRMIEEHNKNPGTEYTRTEFLPLGTTAEVINVQALKRCYQNMDPDKSEYLMLFIFNPEQYNCLVLLPEKKLQAEYTSLTVDTPPDWERTEFIAKHIYKKGRMFYDDLLELSQKSKIPYFEVDQAEAVKLPEGNEVSFEEFRKKIMAGRVEKARKLQLEEGFYAQQKKEKKSIWVKGKEIGGKQSFILAEIASSHGGDPELLKSIFQNSIKTGADAVKVQIFNSGELCSKYNPDAETAKKIEISSEKWKEVLQSAASLNVITFAEVFDEKSLELAAPLVDGLSLHGTDLTNPALLERAARKNKPLILNVGGSTLEEIWKAVEIVEKSGNRQIMLVYGVQNFPTKVEEVHLHRIKTLREEFSYPVGYHDHTEAEHPLAITLPLTALAGGAQIIEKHITDDRSKKGFDYISSLHQEEFSEMVKLIRNLESSFGSPEMNLSESDQTYRKKFKRYLVAKEDLKPGTVLGKEHFAFKRTRGGLLPTEMEKVLGRKLVRELLMDQAITEEVVEKE